MLQPKKPKKSSKTVEYSKKTTTGPAWNTSVPYYNEDSFTKAYKANKKGVVTSVEKSYINVDLPDRYIGSSRPEVYRSMDTTGYSKGKPTYTLKMYTRNVDKERPFSSSGYKESYTEKKIPRNQVKSTISKMKKGTK